MPPPYSAWGCDRFSHLRASLTGLSSSVWLLRSLVGAVHGFELSQEARLREGNLENQVLFPHPIGRLYFQIVTLPNPWSKQSVNPAHWNEGYISVFIMENCV